MEQPDARQVLQRLVQGLDPLSGEDVPGGPVWQQPEVIQAFLAAIAALEADATRVRRRAQLPENVGRPWSAAEEQRLTASFRAGEALPVIAAQHGRTLAAIEARLEALGLIAPEQRVTRNRYISRSGSAPSAT